MVLRLTPSSAASSRPDQCVTPRLAAGGPLFEGVLGYEETVMPQIDPDEYEGKLPAELRDKVQYGAGPRASIALLLAGKARALLHKRCHVTTDDICAVAPPVLRHRIARSGGR